MSNYIQLDSVSLSNFIQFNFRIKDYSSGEEGDGMKRKNLFLGSGRESCLVPVFCLKACDCLTFREEYDWLANDVS